MDFTGLKTALTALVQQNGISVIIVFIIVIHGITTKILRLLNKGGKKEKKESDGKEEEVEHPPSAVEDVEMIPFNPKCCSHDDMLQRSAAFFKEMDKRRSVRFFSDKHVPLEVIKNCIKVAGTAPSGAHTQPWTYAVIQDQDIKEKIREIIEAEEEINYRKRMSEDWKNDLKKLRTNWEKPYLTIAPYLIIVFKQLYGLSADEKRLTHYYSEESIGLSCGLLIAAIQNAGLCTLTSTPMNAGPKIRLLLNRGKNEKLFLLMPVGYASEDCKVPDLKRKPLDEIMVIF